MNLDISSNLRRLRKERGITQEKLADYLGVSFQAVSKWECGEGYPDITFILPLASYFSVSTDELLGMKSEKEQALVDEIIKRVHLLTENIHSVTDENRHLFIKGMDILTEGFGGFPNNFKLMLKYASALQYDYRINYSEISKLGEQSLDINGNEIERIVRRILEGCSDPEIRRHASAILIRLYAYRGEHDKAVKICKEFPEYPTSQNIMMTTIYDYADVESEANLQYRKVFFELFINLIWKINYPFPQKKDKKKYLEKTIKLCDAFFDDGEYGALASIVMAACLNSFIWTDFNSDPGLAITYLRKAFETAKYDDDIYNKTIKHGQKFVYESFLARGVELDPVDDFVYDENLTSVQCIIDTINARIEKDDPHVKALIDEYKPYGGTRK